MLDTILSFLRRSTVAAWEVEDVITDGWEFYFIRHALDQNRVKHVEHISVKVFHLSDDGETMGFASCEIPPTASEEDAEALINSLAYRASLVKNKPFTLHKPDLAAGSSCPSINLENAAGAFLRTMRDVPETLEEDINSYEIFVSSRKRRFLNSEGIDIEEVYPDSMVEVVVNARRSGREIELYRNFKSGTCDEVSLRRDLLRAMQTGRDRLVAEPTPALGKADVLFSTADSREIYSYFVDRLNTAFVYRKMSDWQLGQSICPSFGGDRLSISAVRELPNSSANRIYDTEGVMIHDVLLLENGVARHYIGNRMFSSYLGLEDTFVPTNFAVSGGTWSEAELRHGPLLEVVEFSDFQVDAVTGDIFGEIRLAYWNDGEKTVPVTGGSISGSMLTLVGNMFLSTETVQYNNWVVPSATLLKGVTVTGIA